MAEEYNLRPIWGAILNVYQEAYKICERHNLRIFVAFGTEIGAMRHGGFIPWDDDFDVLMPRPDYNKFMEYAAKELPSHLKWHSIETDPEYKFLFGKVQDERTGELEKIRAESNLSLEQGVFVDFFPMDGLPSTSVGVFIWNVMRSFIRRFIKPSRKTLQSWISRRKYDNSKHVGWCLSDFRYPKFIYKRAWFESARMVPFEDVFVPVPEGVEEHLASLYGDYKKCPPEAARKPAHQIRGNS